MTKSNVLEYDIAAAANNSDIGGINIQGTAPVSNFDNAFRELMLEIGAAVTRHVTKAVGSYTALKTDHNQFWRATGAVTLNLTAAATLTSGWALWVKADGGAITVDPAGAETINGAATLTVANGTGALIICTGTTFFAVTFNSGNVAGAASSTDNAIARFDGTTGKIVQNSAVTIDDSGNIAGVTAAFAGSTTAGGTATADRFASSASSAVFGGNAAKDVVLRPDGVSSTTGQLVVEATTGNVTINGTLTVTG